MAFHENVPGLLYVPNFITEAEESSLLQTLEESGWSTELEKARRVQHFGFRYDYVTECPIKFEDERAEFPACLQELCERIIQLAPQFDGHPLEDTKEPTLKVEGELTGAGPWDFNQIICNDYAPTDGIRFHIDRTHCFGPLIPCISLGAPCVIQFKDKDKIEDVLVEPRSLYIMSGPARYQWQHGIQHQNRHVFGGKKFKREQRVSITLRTVTNILARKPNRTCTAKEQKVKEVEGEQAEQCAP
eukprot:TRINITY_DN106319_c0_g1_i1.p1 TRINITY_DN106319_c0_g1~~TRINITY_DN106319_c0_g1_i1.p1  ORF type:complete len:257 (+),score=0.85 TRINITY_DN106319_c0_g1_i1:42-773(+)